MKWSLAFLFPSLYPLRSPVVVNSFIPPPFSDFFPLSPSSPSPLQGSLEDRALSLVGEEGGAVYHLIEHARQWMEEHLDRLRESQEGTSSEGASAQSLQLRPLFEALREGLDEAHAVVGSEKKGGVMVSHAVKLFGRGRVERPDE